MNALPKPDAAKVLAIFRPAALDHHISRLAGGAQPEFLRYRFMGLLWLITLASAVVVAIAWAQPTPHMVPALSFWPVGGRPDADMLVLVLPDAAPAIQPGQPMACKGPDGRRIQGQVTAVEARSATLAEVRARYPAGSWSFPVNRRMRIAHARLSAGDQMRVSPTCDALIKVGTRPLHSYLPLSGPLPAVGSSW